MLSSLLKFIVPDAGTKYLKRYQKDLLTVKALEEKLTLILTSEDAIKAKTAEMMQKFEGIDLSTNEGKTAADELLTSLKCEAMAVHRIACRLLKGSVHDMGNGKMLTWNLVPYDVQILGAMALHDGNIAEMKTGEGKTLVATIAAYTNALAGVPVHIVTVNDYLARRDATEMGILYRYLGLTVGIVTHMQDPIEKRSAYQSNIVYATNNELGFDYLRDNMASSVERIAQGPLRYAIVDEVDSILVDEARTPLIISAPDGEPTSKYARFVQIARSLSEDGDYKIDEKHKTATLTESGIKRLEETLGVENIYLSEKVDDIHHIENALKARTVYKRDIDYLVRDDALLIIDEHTGRVLPGRRYSDGLHQALEAKEGITIQQESKTLASITFQNLFRLYDKLSGMTGTAKTEEEEFYKIYRLTVVEIPTNRPMIRQDMADLLFKNEKGKYAFAVDLIKELHSKGQSVLVGTVSVAKSEYLSDLLTQAGVPHNVLNAKQDAREAEVISQAGRLGAVTIATNMAGRGTDIKLDTEVSTLTGEVTVAERFKFPLGGLFVIGMEKHETRRIDNQLRGRSGRQGDPGASIFMVSPQDDIMRIFGGDKLFGVFNSPLFAAIPDHEPLNQSSMLTKKITTVQKQVEGRHFDTRKHVLEYDDVLNQHRTVMYARRKKALTHTDVDMLIEKILDEYLASLSVNIEDVDDMEREEFCSQILTSWNELMPKCPALQEELVMKEDGESIRTYFKSLALRRIDDFRKSVGAEEFARVAHAVILQSTDILWMNHIDAMTRLRDDVAFEGYAQRNPLVVYKEKAYDRFVELLSETDKRVIRSLLAIEKVTGMPTSGPSQAEQMITNAQEGWGSSPEETSSSEAGVRVIHAQKSTPKKAATQYTDVGRNDPCPCGSGKKFKHCHGKNA